MMTLDEIKKPIEQELIAFEALLIEATRTEFEQMRPIAENLYNLSGKRMRPILTLLVAKLHGEITTEHLVSAALIEIVHSASLIHDDVLDEAYTRRGEPTINAIMCSKGAVLVGDFLLASGISLGVKHKNFKAIELTTKSLQQLVEGELKQMHHAMMLDMTIENYYKIIGLKTACLLGTSAEAGAPANYTEQMYQFGNLIGEAFQIQDDVLDLTGQASGKPLFADIKERKITLPLLLAMEQNPNDRTKIINLLEQIEEKGNVEKIAEFVLASSAIEQCTKIIDAKREEALEVLHQYPDTPQRKTLEQYADFVTKRKY